MGLLTPECLEHLKQKVDLVELLSSYLPMKRMGAYYKALCPFHDEQTPSFVVQPGTQHYHCFGCQAHGDAISFLMSHQQLSFNEAVECLAERFQVPLEYVSQKDPTVNKTRLIEVLSWAHHYYQKKLQDSPEGKVALDYLDKRGIQRDFIEKFELGLAPKSGSDFLEHMKSKGATQKELEQVGLLSDSHRPFFYERITFPIRDSRGSVIAFSARLYLEGTKGGKYINSKETYLFKKSNVLFALNYSRMRLAKNKKALIVEGQIDALRLVSMGLNATVAPLGTALTEQHVEKLNQLGVETAYLAFDSDSAGINAAIKSGNLLQKKGISVFVLQMPKDMDPDAFIQKQGIEAFRSLLKNALDYLTFLMDISSQRTDLSIPANKARVVEKISKEIKSWEHPVMVYESLKKLSELSQVPSSTLGLGHEVTKPHYRLKSSDSPQKVFDVNQLMEADVLAWLVQSNLKSQELLKVAAQNLPIESFEDPSCLYLYKLLISFYNSQKEVDRLSLLSEIQDESTEELFKHLLEKKIHKEQAAPLFTASIQKLLDRNWMKTREQIKVKIQSGMLSDQQAIELAKEFDQIQKNRPQVNW